jgi:tetratricopeptide (TPR) repeat protein
MLFSPEYPDNITRVFSRTRKPFTQRNTTESCDTKKGGLMSHFKASYHNLALFIVISSALFLFSQTVHAEYCEEWVAKAVSVQGKVEVRRADELQWRPVSLNTVFCPGDTLRAQELSRAAIFLINETIVRLDQNTTITFTGIEEKQTSLIDVLSGVAHFISRVPRTLKIMTPFVNAAVEGTEFLITVTDKGTTITVYEGQVKTENEAGSLTLTSGQSALAEAGQAPVLHVVIRPRDAVQWALYYPSVLHYRVDDFPETAESDWQANMRASIQHFQKGDVINAFSSLKEIPEEPRDHRFYNFRALLLLSVGRVPEAKKDIAQSMNVSPGNSDALSLQSIIETVKNEIDQALSTAQKAVEAGPQSSSAQIALSYALQAAFRLNESLEGIKKAVQLDPENSIAWARLSELYLSFGHMNQSLDAAKKAVNLNPSLAHTQSVLGFAYLTQVNINYSIEAFEKAIVLDQADPLPRLGLGLAMIRNGKLKQGREEIEIATSLDPNHALIRSYMGKAYYEEKRNRLAKDQFSIARELDPLDPTPFFYDAIRKQSENKPVEALHDLQKSIELNDNRAVYRSRQLLDQDLAARSAGLARTYDNLGFQQLALVEGWKSVNTDPGSYSAHRFLSDSYVNLPRHEIARVSELLQSQLLQPINITPVQPSLAESDLSILRDSGPGSLSFNEFNPLFNRNRFALQASGVAGEQKTTGDELVFSGIHGPVSFSMGQFHYETDGFRENNDLEQDIYNVFYQISATQDTGLQAEFRTTDSEKGDRTLNFNPDDFFTEQREQEQTRSMRLGLSHAFSPQSQIIISGIYNISENNLHTVQGTGAVIDLIIDDDSYSGELQHLFQSESLNIISGAGRVNIDRKATLSTELPVPFPPFVLTSTSVTDSNIRHTNLYVYSQIKYLKNMEWTVGGSVDLFENTELTQTQVNPSPKLGLIWNLLPSTTLRAALFRAFTRTLTTAQTIEPTQVAGFNQFFNDGNGTESWRFGIAIDQKLSDNLYAGGEFSRRDLGVKFSFLPSPTASFQLREVDWEEHMGRSYLYWTPHSWVSLSAEYEYERFKRDEAFAAGIGLVKTHRIPLGFNLHHPCGLSFMWKTTYVAQEGNFQPQNAPMASFGLGAENFWVVDSSLSYRLPRRWGIVSVEAKNLFDKSFNFQDTDPTNPVLQPERSILFKFTLAI